MEFIEEIRKQKEISVTELCEKAGISRRTYYRWLNKERNPKFSTIRKVCEVLNIDFAENVDKFL